MNLHLGRFFNMKERSFTEFPQYYDPEDHGHQGTFLQRSFHAPPCTIPLVSNLHSAILAHAGGALYGMELGSVTLKRIGFFWFPISVKGCLLQT